MWQLIKDLISGTAAFFRIKEKADDRANSPEMVANADAAMRQKIKDDAARAVRENDIHEIRKRAG